MDEHSQGRPATRQPFVVALSDPAARHLALTGGKGANLARLVDAGFDVPPGFCVTTAAYRTLVDDPEIQDAIASVSGLDPTDAARIAAETAEIRERIRDRPLPEAVRRDVERALARSDAEAFAVRSSATAEDLPSASFAGQHETYLAVRGEAAVLDRVGDCLASLFTERAVTYRLRNGVPQADVGMAVVVQAMVDPAVAGVLFTADPLSGNRHVAVVDASFGLGDAVVAGEVSPDSARVDRRTGEVLAYEVGEKARAVRSRAGATGGTETVDVAADRRTRRALTDAQVRTLADLGGRIEALLGAPQDVEWALVDGGVAATPANDADEADNANRADDDEADNVDAARPRGGSFVVLQSRPITSLYPLPTPRPDDDALHVYLSFGHQQAMPEALPPLVVDFWHEFLNGAAARFRPATSAPFAVEAGHRVYGDLTPLLRLRPLRTGLPPRLGALNEPAADALAELLAERPEAVPPRGRVAGARRLARSVRRGAPLVRSAGPRMALRFVRTFVAGPPDLTAERAWFEAFGREVAAPVRQQSSHEARVRAAFARFDVGSIAPRILPHLATFVAAVVASEALGRLFPDAGDEIDAIGKGFEAEVVTRMNQRLGDLADLAREHPAVATALHDGAMLAELDRVAGGPAFVAAFDAFLAEFGHRGTGEIDLRRPRWRDDPAPLLGTIRSNLDGADPGGHRTHLARLERDAAAAAARLEARAEQGRLGFLRRPLVRRLVAVYRGGFPLREYPKQGITHLFAAAHDAVEEAGAALAADGRLARADDVWFLRKAELLAALGEGDSLDVDVAARRRTFERHAALVAPPLLTSEGEQLVASATRAVPEGTLTGTPVSAGVVEGRARVVRDPATASLQPGEILVAPATDPGWTPLFLNAAGLVMEVGGRMTHGALVAREYGLPAVASVANATREIRTGERVRVDGKRGTVALLDRTGDDPS